MFGIRWRSPVNINSFKEDDMVQVFSVLNKSTGKKDLVKAETRGQVTKFLANNFVIEKANALDVADIMAAGGTVQDATAVVEQAPAPDAAAEQHGETHVESTDGSAAAAATGEGSEAGQGV